MQVRARETGTDGGETPAGAAGRPFPRRGRPASNNRPRCWLLQVVHRLEHLALVDEARRQDRTVLHVLALLTDVLVVDREFIALPQPEHEVDVGCEDGASLIPSMDSPAALAASNSDDSITPRAMMLAFLLARLPRWPKARIRAPHLESAASATDAAPGPRSEPSRCANFSCSPGLRRSSRAPAVQGADVGQIRQVQLQAAKDALERVMLLHDHFDRGQLRAGQCAQIGDPGQRRGRGAAGREQHRALLRQRYRGVPRGIQGAIRDRETGGNLRQPQRQRNRARHGGRVRGDGHDRLRFTVICQVGTLPWGQGTGQRRWPHICAKVRLQ